MNRYRLTARLYSPAAVPDVEHAFEPGDPFGCILTDQALSVEEMRAFDLHECPPGFDTPEVGQRRLDQVLGVLEWQGCGLVHVAESIRADYPTGRVLFAPTEAGWLRLAPDTAANRALFRARYWGWEGKDG